MSRRRGILLLLVFCSAGLLLLGFGCESRDHDNPLDPENTETQGVPDILTIIAGDHSVRLLWDDLGYSDLESQMIRRRENGGPEHSIAEGLAPSVLSYDDTSLVNGCTYTYRLEWDFTDSDAPVILSPQSARPGPGIVWSIDGNGGGLLRITPDGQHATQRIGAGRYILDLAVDPETGRVWAADFDREQVLSYEPQTDEVRTWNQEGVNTLSYDPVSRILWAGAYYAETVSALTREGEESVLLSELGHIEDVDARPGIGVYYAAKEGTVGRISLTGEWDEIVVTGWPVAVQWDSLSSGLWILDRGTRQVLFAPDDGSAPDTILAGLGDPIDLGLDGEGRCWVADRAGRTLRCIREGGTDLVLDLDIIPSGVTVDTATGEVWIASVTHQTLRLVDRNGVERFRLQGSFGTKKVEGAWNPGAGPAIGRRPLDFTTRKGPILLTD